MDQYALVTNEQEELLLSLFESFEEAADAVLKSLVEGDMLSESEQKEIEKMLGEDYNMSGYFNDEECKTEVYINKEKETIEAYHAESPHKENLYIARLFVIEC